MAVRKRVNRREKLYGIAIYWNLTGSITCPPLKTIAYLVDLYFFTKSRLIIVNILTESVSVPTYFKSPLGRNIKPEGNIEEL